MSEDIRTETVGEGPDGALGDAEAPSEREARLLAELAVVGEDWTEREAWQGEGEGPVGTQLRDEARDESVAVGPPERARVRLTNNAKHSLARDLAEGMQLEAAARKYGIPLDSMRSLTKGEGFRTNYYMPLLDKLNASAERGLVKLKLATDDLVDRVLELSQQDDDKSVALRASTWGLEAGALPKANGPGAGGTVINQTIINQSRTAVTQISSTLETFMTKFDGKLGTTGYEEYLVGDSEGLEMPAPSPAEIAAATQSASRDPFSATADDAPVPSPDLVPSE